MSTILPNIIDAATGTPWAIEPRRGQRIAGILGDLSSMETAARIRENERRFEEAGVKREEEYLPLGAEVRRGPKTGSRQRVQITEKGTAVVPIHGTIMKRAPRTASGAGGVSTDRLKAAIGQLRSDPTVKRVVLDVNSSGGSIEGIHGAAKEIRKLREEKPTVAIANDRMYSAGYWLGSAASSVYATPSSGIGSIGVIAMIQEQSERLEEAGITTAVIRSVEDKARPTGVEPFREEDLEKIEDSVKHFHEDFVNEVAINRNIPTEKARAMADGTTENGADAAIKEGYADEEASLDELVADFDAQTEKEEALVAHAEKQETTIEGQRQEIADLRSKLETRTEERDEAEEQIAALTDEQNASRVNALVTAAQKQGKFKADKREHFEQMGADHGPDYLEATLDAMAAGSAAPVGESLEADETTAAPGADPQAGTSASGGKMTAEEELAQMSYSDKKAAANIPRLAKKYDLNPRDFKE